MVDIWRFLHPETFQFSFCRMEPKLTMSRIDYFLIPQSCSAEASCELIPKYKTDHSLLLLDIGLTTAPRGPGYWKFNSSLLKDKEFLDFINKIIDEYFQNVENSNETHNPGVIWEALKALLIEETKEYSKRKAKGKHLLMDLLQHKLIKLDAKLASADHNLDKIEKDIKKTEEFLENECEQFTLGAMFRSKCDYYTLGQKPTKYFLNLEKRKAHAKNISMLISNDGDEIHDNKRIIDEM